MSAERITLAVGYLRVEGGSQRQREGNIYIQRQAIFRYAKINWIRIARFFADHACISDITMRQGLSDAMEWLAAGKAKKAFTIPANDGCYDALKNGFYDQARKAKQTPGKHDRADAMRAMDERCNIPELRSFVLAIVQADTFGVSIGRVLRAQSEEMRIKRRQLAQEKAQKAPVKMLIPMVFCIFPALFCVVLGPAALNIKESF